MRPSCRRVVSAAPSVFTVSHTHANAHADAHRGRRQEEKQTQAVISDGCEEARPRHRICRWPASATCACMNAMAIHGSAPITATGLSPIIPMNQLERPVQPPVADSHADAFLWGRQGEGTAQHSTGDERWASSLRPGGGLAASLRTCPHSPDQQQ